MENKLITSNSTDGGPLLDSKKQQLSLFLGQTAKGALVRARFKSINDMDAPSSFFFKLERTAAQRKLMACLRLPDGTVTSDPAEMRRLAVDFYAALYRAEDCEEDATTRLLHGLPKLGDEERTTLDSPITLEELTAAVEHMAPGKAPGVDGLPAEFLRHFWSCLGKDLLDVLLECVGRGSLPASCRRAALSLLPKKGDLALLKNWRPVALLCADYKVFSKALANRLRERMGLVVHRDQAYCIPDRTITDSLFLMRDMFDACKLSGCTLGVLSLDQEKAFDRVDHGYLFSVLRGFGFGEGFISMVGLLYSGASCMVKVGGGLSGPIPVGRGIRQGCPMSGQLYSLAIEPLLCRIRDRLAGLSPPGLAGSQAIRVSAYADDINVFIQSQGDVTSLVDCLKIYQGASSAKVNWEKSGALQVGEWREGAAPSLPGGLRWGREGMKVLGVYLGSEQFQEKNWEGLLEKVTARLSRWNWVLPQLSYRGRVLVANNLVASTLWHKLRVLTPPRGLIERIQSTIVRFFWSGQHWLRAPVLYLPVQEGGQGLIDIEARVAAFRIQAAQRLLYTPGLSWPDTARLLLRRAGRLGYDKHLFLLQQQEIDMTGLTPFYKSMFQSWRVFETRRETNPAPGAWILEEPLFFNANLRTQSLSSPSLRTSLREAGVVKVGHLLRTPTARLGELTGIRSVRVLQRLVEEVRTSLTGPMRAVVEGCTVPDHWEDGNDYTLPSLTVSPAVEGWAEEKGQLLSFKTQRLGRFEAVGKKAAYHTCVKVLHLRSLRGVKDSRWTDVFGPDSSPRGSWRSMYKPPIDKRSGDLQWRVVHGIIATNRHVAHLDPGRGEGCPFCQDGETVDHLFLRCARLAGMFRLLQGWCQGLGLAFSHQLFIFGPRYAANRKQVHVLINFLFGVAKLSIWKTRKNRIQELGSLDPVLMLTGLLAARLRVEFAFYKLTSRLEAFESTWGVGHVLCSVQDDVLLLNF